MCGPSFGSQPLRTHPGSMPHWLNWQTWCKWLGSQLFSILARILIRLSPHRLKDFIWIEIKYPCLAMAMEGFEGQLDCHFSPHQWVLAFPHLKWWGPCLFLKDPIPNAPNIFTDGGQFEAAVIIYHPGLAIPDQFLHPYQGSAQFKEHMGITLALQKVPVPMNLFSDSLYAVNLLPGLAHSYIHLDNNPITPLMIQDRSLLMECCDPPISSKSEGTPNPPRCIDSGQCTS